MFDDLTGAQKELLAHIEFMGRFYGLVSRLDLTSRFDVSDTTATRMFRIYNELAPDNIIYRPTLKRYEWQESARPIIPVSTSKCVSTLVDGFGDSYANIEGQPIAVKNSLFNVDLDVLSAVTRAIKRKQVIRINYLSKTSPEGSERDIVPHSIADSGLRWHVRAFDRKSSEFRDFVINRIKSISTLAKEKIPVAQMAFYDENWNDFVDLELEPHPRLGEAKSMIEFEYRMVNGSLTFTTRKALAGYLLDTWNVDVTEHASLTGMHIMLHLKNSELVNFHSKLLAPST
ncbi:MAG: WYL domain-containing protein [Gammaproteobacteria bacterium]|nr:WYL domain-containing protein [Gammaproteobacteria bacterium]